MDVSQQTLSVCVAQLSLANCPVSASAGATAALRASRARVRCGAGASRYGQRKGCREKQHCDGGKHCDCRGVHVAGLILVLFEDCKVSRLTSFLHVAFLYLRKCFSVFREFLP